MKLMCCFLLVFIIPGILVAADEGKKPETTDPSSETGMKTENDLTDSGKENTMIVSVNSEKITRSELDVDDDLMARVKERFDDDTIVELTGLIAFQNLSSKFNSALNVAPQGFCRLPPVPPRHES